MILNLGSLIVENIALWSVPSETKLDTPCQDMQDLDSLDKTWIILPRSW